MCFRKGINTRPHIQCDGRERREERTKNWRLHRESNSRTKEARTKTEPLHYGDNFKICIHIYWFYSAQSYLGYWYYGVDPTSFPRWKMYRISYIGFFKLWGPRKFSYPTSNIIFQGRKLENLKAYGWKPRKYLGFQFPMFPKTPIVFQGEGTSEKCGVLRDSVSIFLQLLAS